VPHGYRVLAAADWWLLIVVAFAQVVTRIALRGIPLSVLRAKAARLRRLAQFAVRGSEERVAWAIEATGRRLGGSSTCLVRALVAELVLGSPERPVTLTIGVRRTASGALEAHAWVGREGRVLIGVTSDQYVPLVGWSSRGV
jgi:hypothetical protein